MEISENLVLSLLCEMYGNLLTAKQQKILKCYLDSNLSISEIAQINHTTRQATNDIIRRSIKLLKEYENKLCLLKKFEKTKKHIENCIQMVQNGADVQKIKNELSTILEVL